MGRQRRRLWQQFGKDLLIKVDMWATAPLSRWRGCGRRDRFNAETVDVTRKVRRLAGLLAGLG